MIPSIGLSPTGVAWRRGPFTRLPRTPVSRLPFLCSRLACPGLAWSPAARRAGPRPADRPGFGGGGRPGSHFGSAWALASGIGVSSGCRARRSAAPATWATGLTGHIGRRLQLLRAFRRSNGHRVRRNILVASDIAARRQLLRRCLARRAPAAPTTMAGRPWLLGIGVRIRRWIVRGWRLFGAGFIASRRVLRTCHQRGSPAASPASVPRPIGFAILR